MLESNAVLAPAVAGAVLLTRNVDEVALATHTACIGTYLPYATLRTQGKVDAVNNLIAAIKAELDTIPQQLAAGLKTLLTGMDDHAEGSTEQVSTVAGNHYTSITVSQIRLVAGLLPMNCWAS
jgi:uncharacterized phage infection (PIP) family protein YhgE